jgi:hypothetical protein
VKAQVKVKGADVRPISCGNNYTYVSSPVEACMTSLLTCISARYPHPHHSKLIYRPSSPSTRSRALRPIARLPSRAFPPPSPRRSPSSTPFRETSSPARGGSATPTSRRIEGIGHATALASRTEGIPGTDSGVGQEIGFGVRNDGVDWKMMLRLGTNWSVLLQ